MNYFGTHLVFAKLAKCLSSSNVDSCIHILIAFFNTNDMTASTHGNFAGSRSWVGRVLFYMKNNFSG